MPNKLLLAFAKNTRLLNWCDLCLSILCGINHSVFNLAIGHYITVAVVYDPLEDNFLKVFPLLQCVVQLLSIGAALPMLSFLQYVSLKDNTSLPDKFDESTVVYKRKLAIFIRDLAFLASSVLIAFYCSWQLSCPIILMPILVLSWTTFFNQKKITYKALLLAGPICFVFFSMSIGGMYGSTLVDMKILLEPGRIFTIAAGIGSSSFQFSTSKTLLWAHTNPVPKKVISEVKNVDDIRTNEVAIAQTKDKENQVSDSEMLFAIFRTIQLTVVHNPLLYFVGSVACVLHSFGWPVFTRLTGMFFSVFELRQDAANVTQEEQYLFYSLNAAHICMAYAIMGLIVFFSVLTTGYKAKDLENHLDELTSAPKLSNLFVYGALCMSLSITSSLLNNRWMGSVSYQNMDKLSLSPQLTDSNNLIKRSVTPLDLSLFKMVWWSISCVQNNSNNAFGFSWNDI
uniref:Uncharacterized protein n=1 Tax=Ditylenchus dipsaci TaxID=166011 RepID=A0A915CT81_9BILA